ncbi:isoleucine--tRNA ligase [bacterium]|nr:isoleucine--tRNA ligase [bacterium]
MSKPKDLIITDLSQTPDFPAMEEKIADFWDEHQIFAKTLEQTQDQKPYVFFDGPPFATGLPHYGHIVASTTKDVFPRYQTMRGRFVKRIWGWDCHGLPIENIIEKDLDLHDRPAILEYGVDKFCDACRSKVQLYTQEWKKTVRRLGRFVDMEHAYKTMDLDYMEAVWGVFADLWEKGLIYQDYKVMHVCPRCSTPLSNSEVAEGYKDVTDISAYVRFRLERPQDLGLEGQTALVAWTTTPWTLPGNLLLAVGKDINYEVVRVATADGDQENLIMAAGKAAEVLGEREYTIIHTLPGTELVGRRYTPPFSYFADTPRAFQVCEADFVTSQEGTGIVHIAPAYGEDDFLLGQREGVAIIHHVDMTGRFVPQVIDFAGMPVKPKDNPQTTDIEIIKYLAHHDLLVAKKKIKHAYPHCWRCDSPLLNYATSCFFVRTTSLKNELLANNQHINWQPEHFKAGRFGKWLEGVRDWAVSRNRFWGTPLPLWKSEDGDFICVKSRQQLEVLSGQKVNDLHKNVVDKVKIIKDGKTYTRVDEVLDCWFESGSMPYALGQFPADFISEGQDQTRGWFYTLHVLATALHGEPAFKNVLVNGIVLAEDGKKMSKKLHNYPDPQAMFDQYGADALRLYLMTSPIMKAESLNFSAKDVGIMRRQVNVLLWNCYVFWRQAGDDQPVNLEAEISKAHLLDRYLYRQVNLLTQQVTQDLDSYHIIEAGRQLIDFIGDLSTFYVRLSRERLRENSVSRSVLKYTLRRLSLLLAPFTPFLSELLYQNLDGERESVHLEAWPEPALEIFDAALDEENKFLRRLIELGRSERKSLGIKNRQPLASVDITIADYNLHQFLQDQDLLQVLSSELNVKKVNVIKSDKQSFNFEFDHNLTPELIAEGQARELIRTINSERKSRQLANQDAWEYQVENIPAGWQEEIERRTNTKLVLKT